MAAQDVVKEKIGTGRSSSSRTTRKTQVPQQRPLRSTAWIYKQSKSGYVFLDQVAEFTGPDALPSLKYLRFSFLKF